MSEPDEFAGINIEAIDTSQRDDRGRIILKAAEFIVATDGPFPLRSARRAARGKGTRVRIILEPEDRP